MEFQIGTLQRADTADFIEWSMRVWEPTFADLKPAILDYVYDAFCPKGWRKRQTKDVEAPLNSEGSNVP